MFQLTRDTDCDTEFDTHSIEIVEKVKVIELDA